MFSKENQKVCALCEHATVLLNSHNEVLCRKKGIVAAGHCCKRFAYDPLKREPRRPSAPKSYSPEDFSIK